MEEDFPNLQNIQEYHTVWHYREENHREKILTKNTEVHILELEKYKRHKKQTGEIDPWLEFFINPYGKEVQDMARTRAELEEAVKQLRLLNADEEVQQLADAEDWARYDYNSAMSEMKQKGLEAGLAEGKAKGLAEGKAKGLAEGKAEGEKKANLKIAQKMLEKKMDINLIAELTGLTKEEIKSLL
jgi:predicted transposase/invertase (TIGR01784 family)